MSSSNGQIIPTAPAIYIPNNTQNVTGSLLEASANKTIANTNAQVSHAKALGVGQKGGVNMNLTPSLLPTANSTGVTHDDVHLKNVNNLNQLRANASGDKLINAPAYEKKGGKRTRRKVNGRRNIRSRRRSRRKHTHRRRRSNRILLRNRR
jgi:hypothetical protein